MKKQLLLGSALLLVAVSAFSQSGQRMRPVGMVNMKYVADSKFADNSLAKPAPAPVPVIKNKNAKSAAVNTWQSISGSMNIYGSVISYCQPLQWNDELNAVTFIHRKSPTYPTTGTTPNTESGTIVGMISTDCGATWDSTTLYADGTHRARYPQGAIYNPPGNTTLSNAYMVACGPITHGGGGAGSGWVGNFYASRQLGTANYTTQPSAVPGEMQFFSTTGPYAPGFPSRHDFSAYNFTATDDGKVMSIAGIQNDATSSDTAVMLVTGTFSAGSGTFNWAGRVFDPPTSIASDGTENWVSRPMMAWNEGGTVGYVVIIGARLGASGSNQGFQPFVYKTVNSGSSWSLENGIDFNSGAFDDVRDRIWGTNIDSTLKVPNFNWAEGIDCVVDANNKLHIFTTILGHPSAHPDSLNFVSQWTTANRYRWPHAPIVDGGIEMHPYMWDFIYDGTNNTPKWSHILVDAMSSEGMSAQTAGQGYQENPWDVDPTNSNQKLRVDARLQISRTPDGQFILYSWTESDTAFTDQFKKFNTLPNIKARLYNVAKGQLHPLKIDVTSEEGASVANRAMNHFICNKFKLVSAVPKDNEYHISIPMTVSNSSPYSQLTPNIHWYTCAALDFLDPTVGVAENKANLLNSTIFPNPAKTNATVKVELNATSQIKVDVLNTIGQVVKTVSSQGHTGTNNVQVDLGGLSSGVYLVTVKTDTAIGTQKLVIE